MAVGSKSKMPQRGHVSGRVRRSWSVVGAHVYFLPPRRSATFTLPVSALAAPALLEALLWTMTFSYVHLLRLPARIYTLSYEMRISGVTM